MPEPIDPETRDLLALHLIPGLGPRLTAALLERFGTPAAVLTASTHELMQIPHIGETVAEAIRSRCEAADLEKELELIERHQISLLRYGKADYPAGLVNIHAPPPLLYLRGQITPGDEKAVAVVGSRGCTAYGVRTVERLVSGLARAGYTIVSGLARGIDGAAHRAALKSGGRTIAVLAGGLARIYPPEHNDLAEEVAAAGALLSESGMTMEPMAHMFPARNRLISALSKAVIVVEAAEKSGALITAHHAAEQGRPVFAVPGPVDSIASAGTLQLIRKGAILIRHADDVLEELEGVKPRSSGSAAEAKPPEMTDEQRRIWDCLGAGARHVDELAQGLQLAVAPLSGLLLTMEMKRIVRRLPGNRYERR